jgi:leucyl aminopeptidase
MRVQFNPSEFQADAVALLAGKDRRVLGDAPAGVERALVAARFEGDAGAVVELLAPGEHAPDRLLIVGAGDEDKRDAHVWEKVGGALAAKLLTSGVKRLLIDLSALGDSPEAADAAARIALGAWLRAYRFEKYQTKLPEKKRASLDEIAVVSRGPGAEHRFEPLLAVARGVALTRDLVTEPGNVIYPESFVERCEVLREMGVQVDVLGPRDMEALGMGALLGVARGSRKEPRLLVLKWENGGSQRPVCFVGKGVTFDTGGISIKPAAGMEDMKYDMAGAGAVVGAMMALAGRRAKANVIGICGLVENMPDGDAQRPGDVVRTMSGQTVEVLNTDAEGRLVLCDALWFAQERFKPEVIIDLATLTGAMVISLGNEYAGMFANDDGLANDLGLSGLASGDKLWRMPLGEAYDKLIESPIADMKNIGGREAGSITAAQFLGRFIQPGVHWAHLDIAGMAWTQKDLPTTPKGATGYGVRLLDRYIADHRERR